MRRLLLLIPILAASMACGGDSSGPVTRTVADVTGTWDFTMASMSGQCSGAAGGGPLFALIEAGPYEPDHRGIFNIVDNWDVTDDPPYSFDLTGNVDLSTGAVELRFWKTIFSSGALLSGSLNSANEFSGTLTDPIPGYEPIFVFGSCVFPVTGQRRQ